MIVFRLYSVLPRHVVNKTGCNLLIEMHYFERQGGGGRVLLEILGGGVPPGSQNLDAISDCEKL